MAEFQEVIKQMKRMCDHLSPTCNGCKLCLGEGTNAFCGEEPKDIRSDPALVEAVVMAWAAEHPEPKYPTWYEWLTSIGAVTRKVKPDVASALIETGLLDPIPADIAQKLGIEPKGVDRGT